MPQTLTIFFLFDPLMAHRDTVREKRRQFQNELTLKHSEIILELFLL